MKFVQAWLQDRAGDTITDCTDVTEEFIGVIYTPSEARTPEQRATLILSNDLIAEQMFSNLPVLGDLIDNVTAVFKAYMDQMV